MEEPTPSRHRRRERRRDRAAQAPPEPVVETAAETAADEEVEEAAPGAKRKTRGRRTDAERSLRGIVGAGSSQVGVIGAMRARDAAKPTAEDLAAAERDVVVVHRHYVPPDTLPGGR